MHPLASTHRLTVLSASVVVALVLTGCASSSSDPAVVNPFTVSTGNGALAPHIGTARVFGDSYSDINFTNSRRTGNWVKELTSRIPTDSTLNYAIGGARAGDANYKSFNRQIDNMELAGQNKIGDADLTIVYLGHNDINRAGSPDNLAKSRSSYTVGVDRLIQAGATKENNRLFLTQLHDWSRNPGIEDTTRDQVVAWNTYIASLANANDNVIAVDMFTAFERVFGNPSAFGFSNVSTPDSSRSAIDALFNDSTHFGTRGQTIIARVYEHYLTRGWNWANTVNAGSASALRLGADIDGGILAFNAGQKTVAGAFNLIPIGQNSQGGFNPVAANRFTVSGKAQGSSAPAGLALDFTSSSAMFKQPGRFGFALTNNANPQELSQGDRLLQRYTSSASTVYWHQPLSNFLLTSQLSNLRMKVENNARDELLNRAYANTHTGSTWSFEQKIRRPMGNDAVRFTPWLSMTSQSHRLNGYTTQSLYTSDLTFRASSASDLLSGVGFDVQFLPLSLGYGRTLNFSGGINHTESLRRSSVGVAVSEARLGGVAQREDIERAKLRSTILGLNASMDLSRKVNLTASYATDLQRAKESQRLNLLAHFQF